MRRLTTPLLLLLALACRPDDGDTPPPPPPEAPFRDPALVNTGILPLFHRASRRIDLTGTPEPDSVVLSAHGARGDSLVVRMEFFVDGQQAFRRSWWSSYDLTDQDSVRADPQLMRSFLISRFDRALGSVVVEPLDRAAFERMSYEPEILDQIQPPPRSQVTFGYGYETVAALAFDPQRSQFVVLWECC